MASTAAVRWPWQLAQLAAAALFTLLLGAAFSPGTARADGGAAQFSVRPATSDPTGAAGAAYFIYTMQPGATVHGQLRVTNTGTMRGSVALYPVDATTGQTSGVVYLGRRDPHTDVGAWVAVGSAQLTLNPGQGQVVPFTVTVPPGARPGQHVGGLVGEDLAVQATPIGGAVQINVQHLSIVAVQVNVPGPQTERLDATHVQAGGAHGYQVLAIGLHNNGTQMLKPT